MWLSRKTGHEVACAWHFVPRDVLTTIGRALRCTWTCWTMSAPSHRVDVGHLQHFRNSCPSAVEWSRGTSTRPASVSTISERYAIALMSGECDFSMVSRLSRIKTGMVMIKQRIPANRTGQHIFRQLQAISIVVRIKMSGTLSSQTSSKPVNSMLDLENECP